MTGRTWKFGDGIDTDVMAPGKYMKLPIQELATHCLRAVRPEFAQEVQEGDVLVAGRNFGIGSSREQAAQALRTLGVRAVVARSFGGIFHRNALNLGLFMLVCDQADSIPDGVPIEVDPAAGRVTLPRQGISFPCEPIPAFLLDMVDDGGLVPHLQKKLGRDGEDGSKQF